MVKKLDKSPAAAPEVSMSTFGDNGRTSSTHALALATTTLASKYVPCNFAVAPKGDDPPHSTTNREPVAHAGAKARKARKDPAASEERRSNKRDERRERKSARGRRHSSDDDAQFRSQLAAVGLRVETVDGDGNCPSMVPASWSCLSSVVVVSRLSIEKVKRERLGARARRERERECGCARRHVPRARRPALRRRQ